MWLMAIGVALLGSAVDAAALFGLNERQLQQHTQSQPIQWRRPALSMVGAGILSPAPEENSDGFGLGAAADTQYPELSLDARDKPAKQRNVLLKYLMGHRSAGTGSVSVASPWVCSLFASTETRQILPPPRLPYDLRPDIQQGYDLRYTSCL